MPDTFIRQGCKINLFLRVGKRLPNGYHELESLFLPLQLPYDVLRIRPASGNTGLKTAFFSPDGQQELRTGEDAAKAGADMAARYSSLSTASIDPSRNTLTRAYDWYARMTGFAPALDIQILKGIPSGAGLGGGSADAAALLAHLQKEAAISGKQPLDRERLIEESKAVGADVPFFLAGGTALVSGVGEKLRPASHPFAGRYLLLLCPGICVSTAWAFSALDAAREKSAGIKNLPRAQETESLTSNTDQATTSPLTRTHPPETPLPMGSVQKRQKVPQPAAQEFENHGNDFEDIVFARHPELARLKKALFFWGACPARMSGTGSSLFGVFTHKAQALLASKELAKSAVSVYMQRI